MAAGKNQDAGRGSKQDLEQMGRNNRRRTRPRSDSRSSGRTGRRDCRRPRGGSPFTSSARGFGHSIVRAYRLYRRLARNEGHANDHRFGAPPCAATNLDPGKTTRSEPTRGGGTTSGDDGGEEEGHRRRGFTTSAGHKPRHCRDASPVSGPGPRRADTNPAPATRGGAPKLGQRIPHRVGRRPRRTNRRLRSKVCRTENASRHKPYRARVFRSANRGAGSHHRPEPPWIHNPFLFCAPAPRENGGGGKNGRR